MNKQKWCWLAREVKGGWRLSLEIGKYTYKPNPNDIFKTTQLVESFANVFGKGKIVFIHLKDSKYPTK